MPPPMPALMPPPIAHWRESPLLVALGAMAPHNFCCWSYELRDERWTKVPKRWHDRTLSNARSNTPATWSSLEDAFSAWRDRPHVDIHGLGFMTGGTGIVFLDIDGGVNRREPLELSPWALAIVDRVPAHWEVSPSGWGLKGWCRAKLPWNGRRYAFRDLAPSGPVPPAIEVWGDKKYGAVTLRHLAGSADDLPDCQTHVDQLIERYFAPRAHAVAPPLRPIRDQALQQSVDWAIGKLRTAANRDKFVALFDRGDTSAYDSLSEADLALASLVRFYTDDPRVIDAIMRRSQLARSKWDEPRGDGGTYLSVTVGKAFAEPRERYNGAATQVAPAEEAPPGWPEPEDRSTATLSEQGGVEYVQDQVRPGRITVWAAEEGSGKSFTTSGELGIRVAVAGGKVAETWPVVGCGGVLVLSEMHADDDFEREALVLGALGYSRSSLADRYFRLSLMTAAYGKPCLREPGWRDWCVEWCRAHQVVLLIVDTATGATDVDPWGRDIQAVYRDLRLMLEQYPALAIILVVHCKKPQGRAHQREISDVLGEWGRWADIVILQERDGLARAKLTTYKRVRRPRRIVATQKEGLLVEAREITDAGAPKVPLDRVIETITATPGMTHAELATSLGVSKRTVGNYVNTAVAQGLARVEPSGARKTLLIFPV